MSADRKIVSSELGTLWMTYQQKTMILRMLEYFKAKSTDPKATEILEDTYSNVQAFVDRIKDILQKDGAVIPRGFTEEDVSTGVQNLFDDHFDIMFLRLLNEISMGLHSLHLSMAYREDLISLYKELTAFAQRTYEMCTMFLQDKNILSLPPAVSMPKTVEFAKGVSYMSGFNLFSEKRSLNTVEVSHIYHALESNTIGQQMITGFAQVANEQEVKKYMVKGKEIAKKVITDFNQLFVQSDIQPPGTWGAKATDSTVAPFSDKMMMYCVSLFCSFSLGSNALGTAFSLRTDLPTTMVKVAKDILEFAHEGGKIMAKNGWMEEPPQMEDRSKIIK